MSEINYKQYLISVASMHNKSMSPTELSIWEDALYGYEGADILRALKSHVKNPDNGKFMPKPADVVNFIDGNSEDAAHIAWQKAFGAITSVGQYEDVCFDDGAIHAVIEEMGGWVKFCMMTNEEISHNTHRFTKLYKTHVRQGNGHPKLLIGIAGAENRLQGRETAKPVTVGEVEQCRLVYKNGGGYKANIGGNLIEDVTKKLTGVMA